MIWSIKGKSEVNAMGNRKGKQGNKRGLDNNKYETASEIGIGDAGFEGVEKTELEENEVQKIVSRAKGHFIGFK